MYSIEFVNNLKIVFKELMNRFNNNAHEKGFWERDYNTAEKLALIHSEVSEALEADRKNDYCSELENFDIADILNIDDDDNFSRIFEKFVKNTFEDECADIVIRTMDLSKEKEIDLALHILAKHRFNTLRPYKHGGKKY